jgi:hypothetical protein
MQARGIEAEIENASILATNFGGGTHSVIWKDVI